MNNTTLKLSLVVAGLLSASTVFADSAKLYSEATGHYYQLIEFDSSSWSDGQLGCDSIGAHMATITSQAEQDFIARSLLKDFTGYYFVGGTDEATPKKWQWVTGEKWGFQQWASEGDAGLQPSNGAGEDFLIVGPNEPNTDIAWFDSSSTEDGYICEWSAHKNIATAIVPDIDGNGVDEVAVLWVDFQTGRHTVQIKDMKTKKLLNTLIFAIDSVSPPQGMIVLKDLNSNGVPEIGVLYKAKDQPAVLIKDAKAATNSSVKTISFFNKSYRGQAVTVSADSNKNGSYEITVLAQNKLTLVSSTETRDSKTGKLLSKVPFDVNIEMPSPDLP